jgi:hypothetical protein
MQKNHLEWCWVIMTPCEAVLIHWWPALAKLCRHFVIERLHKTSCGQTATHEIPKPLSGTRIYPKLIQIDSAGCNPQAPNASKKTQTFRNNIKQHHWRLENGWTQTLGTTWLAINIRLAPETVHLRTQLYPIVDLIDSKKIKKAGIQQRSFLFIL